MSNTELLFSPSFSQTISSTSHSHNSLIKALMHVQAWADSSRVILISSDYCTAKRRVDLHWILLARTGWLWRDGNGFKDCRTLLSLKLLFHLRKLVSWYASAATLLAAPLLVADPADSLGRTRLQNVFDTLAHGLVNLFGKLRKRQSRHAFATEVS